MPTLRKIRFFGLRKQFNIAVEAIQLLLFGQMKMIEEIQALKKHVVALEITTMQEMFNDGWDAAMASLEDEGEIVDKIVDEIVGEIDIVEEIVDEIVEEIDASKRPED